MKHCIRLIYPLVAIACILVNSCKEDKVFPTVSIEKPDDGSSYTFGDTLYVTANVENATENIKVNVLRGSKIIGFDTEIFEQSGNAYTWRLFYTDKYLEGGIYDIRVSASNNGNSSSDFRKVTLAPLPLEYKGVTVLSTSIQGSNISRQDSSATNLTRSLQGDYDLIANRSEFRQLIVAPREQGDLRSFNFKELAQEFSITDLQILGSKQYNQLYVFDRRIYALVNDGRVLSFGETGGIVQSFSLADPFVPKVAAFGNNELLLAAKEGTSNLFRLFAVNPSTGAIIKQVAVSKNVIDMAYAGNNTYFITYSKNDKAIIAEYNRNSNLVTERLSVDLEKPKAILIAEGNGYLATDLGIYAFSIDPALQLQQVFSLPGSKLEYEPVNREVYFASNNTLYKFIPGSSQNQYVLAVSDSIKDFSLMFNK